jgi:hypothetical protein
MAGPNTQYRTSQLTGTVAWSGGQPFDGWFIATLNPPLDGSSNAWPSLSVASVSPRVQLPVRFPILISAGRFDPLSRLIYTADIQPPNTRYSGYYIDLNRVTIPGGPVSLFQVNAPTTTPPMYTLTLPATPTVNSVTLD